MQEEEKVFSYMTRGISRYWRPAMAWQYFAVCIFDFIVMPSLLAFISYEQGITFPGWEPLTLRGGGLYHLSMGAIIGITSFGRSKEKIAFFERFGAQKKRSGYGYDVSVDYDPYIHPHEREGEEFDPALQPAPKPEPKE